MAQETHEINSRTVYEHVEYESTISGLHVYWDNKNMIISDLMNNEMSLHKIHDYKEKQYTALWVDKLKECVGWKKGDVVKFYINIIRNGHCKIQLCYDNLVLNPRKINEDGYLCLPYYERFPGYTNIIYIKCNCLHNDLLDGENEPYVLKYDIIDTFEDFV